MTTFIDRMAHLRGDREALAREADNPRALATAVWRGRNLLDADGNGAWLTVEALRTGLGEERIEIYLGRDREGRPRFAMDLAPSVDVEALDLPGVFTDLMRAGFSLSAEAFEPLAYARGIAHWHRSALHCERCGSDAMRMGAGGFERRSEVCELVGYPRSDPAVMMLPVRGEHCLLARQARFPPGMWSALAGFVEPGESLEDCVRRETMEEVGLQVGAVRYFGSQSWPFPRSLMVGFFAEVEDESLKIDETELEAARWVHRRELVEPEDFFVPPARSLAHHLIRAFAQND